MPQSVPFRLARLIAALALPAAVHAAPPLSLDEALRLAESRSAQLSAQRSAAEASASMALTAGENPDPKLIVGIENAPVEGPDKWSVTADGMTMRRVGVMQDFVRGEKRELMAARAQAEARRESALVDMQATELRKDVAMAFLERLYAEESIRLIDGLSKEAELQVAGTTARLAAGRGDSAEPVMARANLAMLADRRLEAERMARRAEARLSRWLGEDAKRTPAGEPDLDKLPRIAALTTELENHPQLAMFAPMTAAADADAKLAAVATKPDWSVELSYGARGSASVSSGAAGAADVAEATSGSMAAGVLIGAAAADWRRCCTGRRPSPGSGMPRRRSLRRPGPAACRAGRPRRPSAWRCRDS